MASATKRAPLAAHLRQVARTLGIDPEKFAQERIAKLSGGDPNIVVGEFAPDALAWLWRLFKFVACGRKRGADGIPEALELTDFRHAEHFFGFELRPWEIELLRELDSIWFEVWRSDRPGSTGAEDPQP